MEPNKSIGYYHFHAIYCPSQQGIISMGLIWILIHFTWLDYDCITMNISIIVWSILRWHLLWFDINKTNSVEFSAQGSQQTKKHTWKCIHVLQYVRLINQGIDEIVHTVAITVSSVCLWVCTVYVWVQSQCVGGRFCNLSRLHWFHVLTNWLFVPRPTEFALSQPTPAAQQSLFSVAQWRTHHLIRAAGRCRLLYLPGPDRRRQYPCQGSTGGHRWWGKAYMWLRSCLHTTTHLHSP